MFPLDKYRGVFSILVRIAEQSVSSSAAMTHAAISQHPAQQRQPRSSCSGSQQVLRALAEAMVWGGFHNFTACTDSPSTEGCAGEWKKPASCETSPRVAQGCWPRLPAAEAVGILCAWQLCVGEGFFGRDIVVPAGWGVFCQDSF